jgi:hypothetical protein
MKKAHEKSPVKDLYLYQDNTNGYNKDCYNYDSNDKMDEYNASFDMNEDALGGIMEGEIYTGASNSSVPIVDNFGPSTRSRSSTPVVDKSAPSIRSRSNSEVDRGKGTRSRSVSDPNQDMGPHGSYFPSLVVPDTVMNLGMFIYMYTYMYICMYV